MKYVVSFVTVLVLLSCSNKYFDPFSIDSLKVESASSPININISNPRFGWYLVSGTSNHIQEAYQIVVSDKVDFSNIIWDSGKVNSSLTNQIRYQGKLLESNTNYYWKVTVWDNKGQVSTSDIAQFGTSLLANEEWNALWIGAGPSSEPQLPNGFLKDVKEQMSLSDTIRHDGNSLLLRNEFEVKRQIKSAKVHVTGLGYYELYLNGSRVGDHVLSPAKTNYSKEVLYDSYDLKSALKKGKNAFGIHLGNGWYNPYKMWWQQYRMQWFGAKRAILQLEIEYEDGDKAKILTDQNWKYHLGPIMYNCIYDGEYYDANLESENWSQIGFDDAGWKGAVTMEAPKGKLRSQIMPPIRVTEHIVPVKVFNPKPNVQVYDMGQNFAGWAKIKVKGKKGTKLHIQFAEEIHKDGSIDPKSNEQAKAEATYILKGGASETYEPRFTFYGFRYVEVTADKELPIIEKVTGCVVHSDNKVTGTFECGNETINKIQRATIWSQRSNMIGFPSDCPQRDERLGWFGDVQVTAEEMMFNFDVSAFLKNWITGIRKNQDEETGDIPIISPQPYIWDKGVEWSSTYLILIWQQYVYYGDVNILRENYDAMKKYLGFLDSLATDHILKQGWIGDWGSLVKGWKEGEPESIPTAFYYWNSTILAKVARVLGQKEDVTYFKEKAKVIKEAYNAKYFDTTKNQYHKGSQMANAFPLYLGLVPEENKKAVLDNLVNTILVKDQGHLTTGVLGSKYMIDALTQSGREDVAYLLATQTGYPSWSDMVEKYTTMSEFWTLKQSHNHVMTGSIVAFFYKNLAGINWNEEYPGCERMTIKPYIPEELPYVKASVNTVRGEVKVYWEQVKSGLELNIEIPSNMKADVYVPFDKKESQSVSVMIGGNRIDMTSVEESDSYKHYLVGSGSYQFIVNN